METFARPEIEDYAYAATRAEPELLAQLERRTHAEMEDPQMLTGRVEGRLLKLLTRLLRPRLAVEGGTFTGYSALSIAEGLEEGARLITCELDSDRARVARESFASSAHGAKIELRLGPALETLRGITEPIDFSFIDADKTGYPEYYEELVLRTRAGGAILLDNMLMSGRVLDPQDEGSRAVAALNQRIAHDARVENVLLTVRDGVQLVVKL
ncbi:MAG: class I SAM-dependent methyltransferase [Planctomycetota bacterium]|nr:class I SAM-dependent methyltransferase [Planctomycetota bacterium]